MNQDHILWTQLRQGNEKAYRQIYLNYAERLYSYGCRFSKDQMLVEDCIHDLFVNIWKNRENLGDTQSVLGYLCISLRRDIIRKMSRPEVSETEITDHMPFQITLSYEEDLIKNETNQERKIKINNAIQELSDRQREALYMRYFEEMEYEQICEIMGINYQSVRNLISKSIHFLRDKGLSLVLIMMQIKFFPALLSTFCVLDTLFKKFNELQ